MSSPLDASEVEALMQAIQDGRVAPDPGSTGASGPVVPYDLTSQDRIIRGAMPTLDTINDRLASSFGKNLAARTRLDVKVTSTATTLLKFVDVQQNLMPPTTVGVLTLGPGHGMGLVILEGDLAGALLAGALGEKKRSNGSSPAELPRSELTNVERLVLKHVMGIMADALAMSWADTLPFKPEMVRFESDPRLCVIAAPSDVMVMCPFEINGELEGRVQLVLPYSSLEPAKKQLASPPRIGGQQGDARFSTAFERELEEVKVGVCVEMGRRTLNLSDLMSLSVGQVLTLNTAETAPLPVYVQGRPKMTAAPRVIGGGLAAEVIQSLRAFADEINRPRKRAAGPTASSAPPAAPPPAAPGKGKPGRAA